MFAAGVAALVLSILYLLFPADLRFAAVAAIALGGGLFWHSGIMREVSRLTHDVAYHQVAGPRPSGPFSLNLLSIAPVRDALVGLAGVVLGILALLYSAPAILTLVAFLATGAALTFSAATMCGASMVALREVCAKGSSDAAAMQRHTERRVIFRVRSGKEAARSRICTSPSMSSLACHSPEAAETRRRRSSPWRSTPGQLAPTLGAVR